MNCIVISWMSLPLLLFFALCSTIVHAQDEAVQAELLQSDLLQTYSSQTNSFDIGKEQELEESANFMFGLGYGRLNEKSLVNIDLNINMPINNFLISQIQLNSNYLVTGSTKDSFAQSELSSNWFVHNQHGYIGAGIGFNELEPLDTEQATKRNALGQFMVGWYLKSWAFNARYISHDTAFSNITSSRAGVSYYLHADHRVSFYQEKYSEDDIGWRLESYHQPKKHNRTFGIGWIVKSSDDNDYLGVVAQYYFDHTLSLRDRDAMHR
ncbi:hypothetical protein OFY17_05975 [Marinomonas sp. C2222]|uniref:Inverse autotransporter beta-domain domain-containing protein n=1 Tax=Marinomonas sargassi TaxID=2984494 RepID=A0ABT2YRE7_9GAMM|nr:hypothetical protein [Marinomonas sargassi]MCV2402436.1 hypothetical protein [Marinomonas sargassi]